MANPSWAITIDYPKKCGHPSCKHDHKIGPLAPVRAACGLLRTLNRKDWPTLYWHRGETCMGPPHSLYCFSIRTTDSTRACRLFKAVQLFSLIHFRGSEIGRHTCPSCLAGKAACHYILGDRTFNENGNGRG